MATKREQYREKLHTQLDEVEAQLGVYEGQVERARIDSTKEYEDEWKDVVQKRDDFRLKLEELDELDDDADDSAWESLRESLDLAWNELSKSAKQVMSGFKALDTGASEQD